jgi:hypothetical protein
MENYSSGTVPTCSHGECGCRVLVESECHCADAGEPYVCTCGSPMVKVVADADQVVGASAH